jgi:ABC-2 type transport system permease protein
MLGSVFGKAVWDRRRSMLWWILGMVAMTGWLTAFYPIIRDSDAMQDFLEDFPPEMMALFGIDPDTFLTGAGYLQAQMFSFLLPIVVLVFTIGFGVAATAREERDGTMDMILSMPISRTSVIVQKATAMTVLSLALLVAVGTTLLIANPIVDLGLGLEGIAAVTAGLWLLGLVFGGVAMLTASFSGSPSTAAGVTGGLAILSWFINAFSSLFSWLELPSTLSPFTWYLHDLPLLYGFNSGHLWMLLISLGLIAGAVILFHKRNIATEEAVIPEAAARRKKSKSIQPRSVWLLGSVFGKSIWDRRRSIWYWSVGLASMSLLTFAAWPTVSQDTATLEAMMEMMPREVLAMFGLTDPEALATAEGFVSSRTYGSVGPIVLIVFAITAMSALVAKEEASGALDLVLSNPRQRRSVLHGKALAVATLTGVLVTFLTAVAFFGNAVWDMGFNLWHIVAANLGLGLLGLCFWGIAIALWAVPRSAGSTVGITSAVAVFTFFLNGLGAIVDVLQPARYLSPFYWYLGDTVPLSKGFTFGYLALAVVAVVGSLFAARSFETRDLAV